MTEPTKSGEPARAMLKYRTIWLCLGLGWVALVVYLSLADVHLPQASVNWSDKINHAIAYGFLMGWFGQLYPQQSNLLVLAALLFGLGIAMEIVQGYLPYRWFDIADSIANTAGIVVAYFCLRLGAVDILGWLERRLM